MLGKILSLLIFSLLIVGCGKGGQSTKYSPPKSPEYSPLFIDTDPEFNLFIMEFSHQYSLNNGSPFSGEMPAINFYDLDELPYLSNLAINISKHFNHSGSTMAGVCLSYPNGKREILIDTQIWDLIDQGVGCFGNCFERKQALIFHELGHCVLDRDHKDDKHEGYNLSIMNSVLIRQNDVVRWESDYFQELFTNNHSNIINSINSYLGI